eukprot:scaffold8587_cov178-Skeletonema_dohrnii-CCMP3373.AAC.1
MRPHPRCVPLSFLKIICQLELTFRKHKHQLRTFDLSEAQAPAAHLSPVCVTSRVRITKRPTYGG